MSFFDRPYFALTKAHMCRIGVWPEQSRYVRIIRPLTMHAVLLSAMGPMIIQAYGSRGDVQAVIHASSYLLSGIGLMLILSHCMIKVDQIKLMLDKLEGHWKLFKNTSAVLVLDEYAQRERHVTIIYTICVYTAMAFYLAITLTPTILDFVDPLNETRSKYYIFEAEYGVDPDKYYWFICAHSYIVVITAINIIVGVETMYFLLVVHACGLFELVGFHLKSVTSKSMLDKKNAVTVPNDDNYKNICACIDIHKEAISFADLIEQIFSDLGLVLISIAIIVIILTALQALLNIGRPNILLQAISFNLGQVIHLYLSSIPGQKLIDHSRRIHTAACDLDWYDFSVKAQKLLILILMRSNKPCQLTTGKVYVLSMKAFGSTLRTSLSYFMIIAQLL